MKQTIDERTENPHVRAQMRATRAVQTLREIENRTNGPVFMEKLLFSALTSDEATRNATILKLLQTLKDR